MFAFGRATTQVTTSGLLTARVVTVPIRIDGEDRGALTGSGPLGGRGAPPPCERYSAVIDGEEIGGVYTTLGRAKAAVYAAWERRQDAEARP